MQTGTREFLLFHCREINRVLATKFIGEVIAQALGIFYGLLCKSPASAQTIAVLAW